MTDLTDEELGVYYVPETFLVNHSTKKVEIDNCTEQEFQIWLSKGFIAVDKRTYLDCKDKFYDWHQARIRKTQLQKLRRLQGYSPTSRK